MVLEATVVLVSVLMLLVGVSVDLVIQDCMVGWVTLSEWLACMEDFLEGMDMGVMDMVKSMADMVVEKDMADMVVEKDMARATTATRDMAIVGTDDPPEILRPITQRLRPTTLPLRLITLLRPTTLPLLFITLLRPTTQPLLLITLLRHTTQPLLLITLILSTVCTLLQSTMPTPMQRISIINQFLVMVLIKPIGHLRSVTSLSDIAHSTPLADTTHPDVTDRCGMANSRVMVDIMFVNL